MLKKCDGRTDERTNKRTNGQTDLCIELRYAQLINFSISKSLGQFGDWCFIVDKKENLVEL